MLSILTFLTFPSFAGYMSFEKLLLVTLFLFWSFSWTCFDYIMPGKTLKLKAFTSLTYLRFQILLAFDEHLNWRALKCEHTSFHIYVTAELKNVYLHKYKEKEKVNISNMLIFYFYTVIWKLKQNKESRGRARIYRIFQA